MLVSMSNLFVVNMVKDRGLAKQEESRPVTWSRRLVHYFHEDHRIWLPGSL